MREEGKFGERISLLRRKIEERIRNEVKKLEFSELTNTAVDKAVSYGGKRIRSILSYIISKILGLSEKEIYEIFCAIEFSHAFTLVHDDMIDRPEERRGNPPIFSEFGEDIALLVGDMLFALSFSYLSYETSKIFSKFIQDVIEGQILDVLWMKGKINKDEKTLKKIQELKTSSLFKISVLLPLFYFSKGRRKNSYLYKNLELFGHHFGFAFQILDDIKDLEEDRKRGSPNILDFLGEERTLKLLEKHGKLAMSYLDNFLNYVRKMKRGKNTDSLAELLKYFCSEILYEKNLQTFSSHKRT